MGSDELYFRTRGCFNSMIFFIGSVACVVIVSFCCSLAEAVILSINVKSQAIENPTPREQRFLRIWNDLRKNISKPIAAILILNTVANTGGSVVASSAFLDLFGARDLWVFSLIMTLMILFGTEIMPKIIGVEYNRTLIRYLVFPLSLLTKVFAPIIYLTEICARPFKNDSAEEPAITSADITAYAALARARKNIDLEQESIIINAVRLKHSTVRKVMVPREKIQYIINGMSLKENEVRLGGVLAKTRYPVCASDSVDAIIGTVNHKKFELVHGDSTSDFTGMLREAIYINEEMTLIQALKMMRWNKRHMIFARDNENRLTGLITLEDIMDELVDVALPD